MEGVDEKTHIRGVIFDIDGTLVDSFEAYYAVFNEGTAGFGRAPISRNVLRDHLAKGLGLREILEKVYASPVDDVSYEACRLKIHQLFRRAEIQGVRSFPGTEEMFRGLKEKGLKIGIATGRMSSVDDEWLRFKRLGLDGYISTIVTSREVEHRKPAPDAIVECAERMNIPIENCIVVGDTEADIVAAKSAGAFAVAVATGHEDREVLVEAEPAIVLNDTRGLLAYIESSFLVQSEVVTNKPKGV